MKKIVFILIAGVFSCFCYAQNIDLIKFYQGTNEKSFMMSEIDSITHSEDNTVYVFYNNQKIGYPISLVDSIVIKKGGSKELTDITITNVIDWSALPINKCGYKLLSMQQEIELPESTNSVQIHTIMCNTPQVMLLLNENNEIVMMSKGVFNNGDINIIDAHSTAIALVTMHPIFGYVSSNDYNTLIQLITSSHYFEALETQIRISIEKGNSLFIENNNVMSAFSTLMEDLTSVDFDNSYETLDVLQSRASNRNRVLDIGRLTNIGPFEMVLRDGFLLVTPRFNTPFYEGTVTSVNGTETLNIQDGKGLGILNMLVQPAGQQILYNFNNKPDGEYRFHFDRTTVSASANLLIHVLGDVLDIVGLPAGLSQERFIVDEFILRSAQFDLANGDVSEIIGIATSTLIDCSKRPEFQTWMLRNGIRESAREFLEHAVPIIEWYGRIRGSVNTIARISLWLSSPQIIDFRLCHNDGVTTACTQVKLEKSAGDNQEGYKGERLTNALEVKVYKYTEGDNYSYVEDKDNYYRVKYTVESGGGHLGWDEANITYGYATTYWWLGDEDTEQKVRACVVDIATGQEISEPVYFTATTSEKINLTFRLDWDRTLSSTDIDLHVYCPKGHHIYYQTMACECGGELDRDDTQGPGPEHIRFMNAAPGEYKVYVHHYESESKAVIGYSVTTTTNEHTYRNVGSVSYHAMNPVGKLIIPERTNNSRSISSKNEGLEQKLGIIEGDTITILNLPRKEK